MLQCAGFSLQWLLLLGTVGSRAHRLQQLWDVGSVGVALGIQGTSLAVVAHGLRGSTTCGVFLDMG